VLDEYTHSTLVIKYIIFYNIVYVLLINPYRTNVENRVSS